MRELWSPEHKVVLERRFWLSVLRAQIDLGLDVEASVIADYEAVIDRVDLASIDARERVTRHDVKARIEEFCALGGHEQIHRGMTSRDLTENVEQSQIRQALELVRSGAVATLERMAAVAASNVDLAIVGRSHNVAAQVTTLGKRIANAGEELLYALGRLDDLLARYPLRGLKGPVGTQQDQLDLFGGDTDKVDELEARVASELGFSNVLGSVGQVYPRSLDLDVVAALVQVASGPANFALTLRLMAGHELVTEGFKEGQVGSSAMPHKMNTRSSERIGAFTTMLRGHLTMAAGLVGDQWNEGDVSCSAVRRIVLPDAFFAIDGLFQTTLSVLDGFGAYDAPIAVELERYLPFLATTRLLGAATVAGMGREDAHEVIKEHAVGAVLARRAGDEAAGDMIARLGADDRFPLSAEGIGELLGEPLDFAGGAVRQVTTFCETVAGIVAGQTATSRYAAAEIL